MLVKRLVNCFLDDIYELAIRCNTLLYTYTYLNIVYTIRADIILYAYNVH